MSILSMSTMNKCLQLIDKVSELRFLKVRERQVNKFNRLLLKKEGNIAWLVPTSTPVNRANPQAGRQANPQAGSASTSTSVVPPGAGSSQTGSTDFQAVSASPQASQAVISQGDSTVLPKAGNFQVESADSQAVSTSPQVSQAIISQGDNTVPPR